MRNLKGAPPPINHPSPSRRKRLGQFFTGPRLARLLAALARAEHASSVIDPMSGTGDMLRAAREFNAKNSLFGIEIDSSVAEQAKAGLLMSRTTLVQGNAFSFKDLHLTKKHFDLVITNPPYVRYQSFAEIDDDGGIPGAEQVRDDLLSNVDLLLTDKEDQRLFREIIKSYSGLSDLAVPSWILSVMLTKVGGTLALVVPESWLSRDYARAVQYILLRWFRIKYIVEDTNAVWFPDALVKTTLLVAERIERRTSAFSWRDEAYAHVKIFADATTSESIVGKAYPHAASPERNFSGELQSLLNKGKTKNTSAWSMEIFRLSEIAENLRASVNRSPWIRKIDDLSNSPSESIEVPMQIRRLLTDSDTKLRPLTEMGVIVGQGLRTGSNSFFYSDLVKNGNPESVIMPNRIFNTDRITVPTKYLLPVLRRQSELPEGYSINKDALKGRVLVLGAGEKVKGGLAILINKAEKTTVSGKLIPQLSAVKTNVKGNAQWYVLPTMTPRHIPQLLIPRINGGLPRSYICGSKVVVDANFSTIWLTSDSMLTAPALLAFLNSSWAVAIMELSGAVMGGGALKLEAAHIKRIPIPLLTTTQIKKLDALGRELITTSNSTTLRRINDAVAGVLFKKSLLSIKTKQLDALLQRRLNERIKRA